MAASRYGNGRIVAVGHESYLFTFPDLVENALTWLRGGESGNPYVGVQKGIKGVADNLNTFIFQVRVVEAFSENLGFFCVCNKCLRGFLSESMRRGADRGTDMNLLVLQPHT